MTKGPRVIYNETCLKCNACNPEMVRIGFLGFCDNCYDSEFSSEDPVRDERANYLKWMQIRSDKATAEADAETANLQSDEQAS